MSKADEIKLDKNKFYEQLKLAKHKYVPIFIQMPIGESKYSIILDEFRNTTDKLEHQYILQIFDRTISGYKKYICKDIKFNLLNEKITSDYKLYRFINKKIQEVFRWIKN